MQALGIAKGCGRSPTYDNRADNPYGRQGSPVLRDSRALNKADGLDGLTSKQQLFVSYLFAGMSDSDAYRQAYDASGMNAHTLGIEANRVRHHPGVALKLRELQDKRDERTSLAASLTREWITEGVMGLAQNADKDSVRLGAYALLGKVAGIDLFRETTRTEHITRTVEDIDRELATHLKALQPMIEGKAIDTTLTPAPALQRDRRRKPVDGRPKIKP